MIHYVELRLLCIACGVNNLSANKNKGRRNNWQVKIAAKGRNEHVVYTSI